MVGMALQRGASIAQRSSAGPGGLSRSRPMSASLRGRIVMVGHLDSGHLYSSSHPLAVLSPLHLGKHGARFHTDPFRQRLDATERPSAIRGEHRLTAAAGRSC